jgi:hypothetical protein
MLLLGLTLAAHAEALSVYGPPDFQWFGDTLAARTGSTLSAAGPESGTPYCHLEITSGLSSAYQVRISPNRADLSGRDRLGLTYACLDFLDSVSTRGLTPLLPSSGEQTWTFTPKTSGRIVTITQSPDDAWPKARTQLYNAIYYGRASEIIIAAFPTVWKPHNVSRVDEMLSICDQYGLQARLLTATFSKWWRGTVPTDRCLRTGIPIRPRRATPESQQFFTNTRSRGGAALDAASNEANRFYIPVDFPRDDDTFRLWALSYRMRAEDNAKGAGGRIMWYRNDRYADPHTDAVVMRREFSLTSEWQTFRDTVCTLEQLHWTAHFQCTSGRAYLDSVRIEEVNPGPGDVASCSTADLPSGWKLYQKGALSTYLASMSLRPELEGSMDAIAQTMDSCYARFHHHPSLIGFFSSCDEVFVMGWEPAFTRAYANAGEGYVDLLRKIARKAHSLFPDSRLLFYGDMLDPFHNSKVYTRACNPRGGGFSGSRHYAEPDTAILDVLLWGEDDTRTCKALLDSFGGNWTWTAGITIANRNREDPAWKPWHPSRVLYYDWGDQYYTPAVLKDLKQRWYQ